MTAQVVVIPADGLAPMRSVTLDEVTWHTLGNLLAEDHGGQCYIEAVQNDRTYRMFCAMFGNTIAEQSEERAEHTLAIIVDEEGLLKRLPPNPRASLLSSTGLVGTAVLVAEGMVAGEPGEPPEPDFVGLPEAITVDKLVSYLGGLQ